jgi:superfamily II DNA/RNA helicase
MEKLKLHPIITQSLLQSGFKNPTPIQAEAIPIALEGKHIVGCAQTGTGKTLAFLVPILSQLLKNKTSTKKITGLILVPTRELAGQIDLEWHKGGDHVEQE